MQQKANDIRAFILNNIESHSADIAALLAKEYGFSRQTAIKYISREVRKGSLIKIGSTRATRYFLSNGSKVHFTLKIAKGLAEDKIWSKYVKPLISSYPNNIQKICAYGFTEMMNNVIDHSEAKDVMVSVEIKDGKITITILDDGIGIFQKIQNALNLESERESILHLSKGKFTTDPEHHSGQGIFFTSRMFDTFAILSDDLFYMFKDSEWMLSPEHKESFGKGTFVKMELSVFSTKTTKEIMDQYADIENGFGKTIVAVALSADPKDPHISRSQAKRLMAGLDKFTRVILDFKGVESVGQAFVDEVFRVFKIDNPNIVIEYTNTNSEVEQMIKTGLANKS